ncbi:hypothetical protein DSECCO2_52870 [anaerobic digester metagenome]
MSRFLTLIPYLAAQKILKTSVRPGHQIRTVPVTKSHGHICHEPVFSRLTIPNSAVSLRDGYAVIASESHSATEANPVHLKTFIPVHTGSPIPDGFDAVIMQEDVRLNDSDNITIIKPARPGQHIQKAGSEVAIGTMVLPAGHLISPEDIGAMIGYGITSVQVQKTVAGLIPTGDELKEPCTAPGPGEVIASNCEMLAASLETIGVESLIYPIVPDDPVKIQNAIEQAVRECSFVIISGGSSTGNRDHTENVLNEIGSLLYHGVAMRPGRTTLAGVVDEIPIFGVPGTPAGALAVLRELIIPWLSDTGYPVPIQNMVEVTLADTVPSELGTDDFILMVTGKVGDEYKAMMLPRGGGQMSAVKSNAVLHIARNSEGIKQGKECVIRLTQTFPHPDNIYLFSGLYDPILDILDQYLHKMQRKIFVRKGSYETTLLSIQNGSIHGGIIIRERIDGENCKKQDYSLLKEKAYAITIADREYILATKGFPDFKSDKIFKYPDISQDSFLYHLMDAYFQKNQVNPQRILKQDHISNTEREIIQKILEEEIDFGPCSSNLASEFELEGPVIGCESIDLIVREEDMESDQIQYMIHLLGSDEWNKEAWILPGYNLKRSGRVSLLQS